MRVKRVIGSETVFLATYLDKGMAAFGGSSLLVSELSGIR
jgi:hypothetical protein